MTNFNARLRSGRERLGLSLDAMAQKAGLSKTYLWELEKGGPMPAADVLRRLADALGMSMDRLWTGRGDEAAEAGLMAYMTGWKRGATGSAATTEQAADPDFAAGYENGRAAMLDASRAASGRYGATLNPLRGDR